MRTHAAGQAGGVPRSAYAPGGYAPAGIRLPRLAQRPLLLDLTSALGVSLVTAPSCRLVKEASGKIHGVCATCATALSCNGLHVHGHGVDVAMLGKGTLFPHSPI